MQGVELIRSVVKLSEIAHKSELNQFTFVQKVPYMMKLLECDYKRIENENEMLSKENALLKQQIIEQNRFRLLEKVN